MATDCMAPYIAKPSTATVLAVWDKHSHEKKIGHHVLTVSSWWAHGDQNGHCQPWPGLWLSCDLALTKPWSYWRCRDWTVTSPWLSCDLAVTELWPRRDWAVTSPSRDHWPRSRELTVTIYFLMGCLPWGRISTTCTISALAITPSHHQNTHVFAHGRKNMNDIFNNYVWYASRTPFSKCLARALHLNVK